MVLSIFRFTHNSLPSPLNCYNSSGFGKLGGGRIFWVICYLPLNAMPFEVVAAHHAAADDEPIVERPIAWRDLPLGRVAINWTLIGLKRRDADISKIGTAFRYGERLQRQLLIGEYQDEMASAISDLRLRIDGRIIDLTSSMYVDLANPDPASIEFAQHNGSVTISFIVGAKSHPFKIEYRIVRHRSGYSINNRKACDVEFPTYCITTINNLGYSGP